MSTFVDIAGRFRENGLTLPSLNVLVPDAHPYEVLAIQPKGEVALRNDFVGHGDQPVAQRKFSAFLKLAAEKNCDLVLSPEYSCPWDVLANAIRANELPGLGKLWALGCESMF